MSMPPSPYAPDFYSGKTEAARVTDTSHRSAFILRSEGLGRVFDDFKTAFISYRHYFIHISRLPEQMHNNNGPGPGCYFFFNFCRINIQSLTVYINKDRGRADIGNCLGCCKKVNGVVITSSLLLYQAP